MIRAVMFDLDDTLVEINLMPFASCYMLGLARVLGAISRKGTARASLALVHGYLAMDSQDRTDLLTNRQLLNMHVSSALRFHMSDPTVQDAIDCYERTRLEKLKNTVAMARPREGAREALETCRALGLKVALATNPAFSLAVDELRLRWAELDDFPFDAISTLDNSSRLKPAARYYRDFARSLDLVPEECLMVGNDASLDFPRPDIGIPTCYVGHGKPSRPAAWSGPISELAAALPEIVGRLDEEDASRSSMN